MTEVVIWTLVFFLGDLAVIIGLLAFAVRKDREKARLGTYDE